MVYILLPITAAAAVVVTVFARRRQKGVVEIPEEVIPVED